MCNIGGTGMISGVIITRRSRHGFLDGANRDLHVPRTRLTEEGVDRRWRSTVCARSGTENFILSSPLFGILLRLVSWC